VPVAEGDRRADDLGDGELGVEVGDAEELLPVVGISTLGARAVVAEPDGRLRQVGGQGLVAVALGTLPATFSSLVIFLEAVAAASLGWLLLNEPLGIVQALGGVLILFGIYVARPRFAEAGP